MTANKSKKAARKLSSFVLAVLLAAAFIPCGWGFGPEEANAVDWLSAPGNVTFTADKAAVSGSSSIVNSFSASWDSSPQADGYLVTVYYNLGGEFMSYSSTKDTADGGMTVDGARCTYPIDGLLDYGSYGGSYKIEVVAYSNNDGYTESDPGWSNELEFYELLITTGWIDDWPGHETSLCLMGGSNIGECIVYAIDNGMIDWIDKSGDAYSFSDGTKDYSILGIAPYGLSAYDSVEEMKTDAFFVPGSGAGSQTINDDTIAYATHDGDLCTDGQPHSYDIINHKATFTQSGYQEMTCTKCGRNEGLMFTGLKVDNVKLEKTSFVYTGKAIKPKVTVANGDGPLDPSNYTVAYSNNTNVGTAKVVITLKGNWFEGTKTLNFSIVKAASPLKASPKAVTIKYKKLKKKAQTVKLANALKVTGKHGTVTYTKVSVNKKKFAKKFVVNKKTGKITVKKGVKKGTYKLKVKVAATATKNYKAGSKTATITIKVR